MGRMKLVVGLSTYHVRGEDARPKKPHYRPWLVYSVGHNKPELQKEIEKATKACHICGTIAFYRVGKLGFCEPHKAEAYAAQAKAIPKLIRATMGRNQYV